MSRERRLSQAEENLFNSQKLKSVNLKHTQMKWLNLLFSASTRKLIFDSYQIRDNAKVYCLTAREWESVGSEQHRELILHAWHFDFWLFRRCVLFDVFARYDDVVQSFCDCEKLFAGCLSGRNINPSGSFYESRSAYKSTFSVSFSQRELFSWRACTLLSLLLFHCSAKGSICMCCLLSFATTEQKYLWMSSQNILLSYQ